MEAEHPWHVLTHSQRRIDPAAVIALFATESCWPERTAEAMNGVIARGPDVAAWADDVLVGFARAVTDGVHRAYVEDVIVAAEHRGSGISHALMDRLLEELPSTVMVSLFCSSRLPTLYADMGFDVTGQIVMHRELSTAPTALGTAEA